MPDRVTTYHPQMLPGLETWQSNDPEMGAHVVELIEETQAQPESGRGRPKRLRDLPYVWSRRITRHHRLFYSLRNGDLRFLSCYDHDLPRHMLDALKAGEDI